MIRLDQLLSSWKAIREDVAIAVEEFPADDLDYRPTPDVDSFRQIARHIYNVGAGISGMMLARDPSVGQEFRDRMKAHFTPLPDDVSGTDLAAALRRSIEERCSQFAAQPAEFFAEIMTRHFDLAQLTRMEMVQFLKEHELTHRQQLFMYLRLKGMVPATTRRRLARQVAK